MKKLSSTKTALILLSLITFASASGSISSTLAWYAYTTRANVSYSGTSVNETSLLEIGICSDVVIPGMPSYITRVTYAGDSNNYYFSDPGRGLTYDVIAKYLSIKGYATNELEPTTSGSYSYSNNQNSFSLKQSPNEIVVGNHTEAAPIHYVKIPFVFRIQGSSGIFYDNKELWLSKAVVRASSSEDGDVYKAIRMFIDRDERNYGSWEEVSSDIGTGAVFPEGDLGHPYYLKSDDNKLYSYDDEHDTWDLLVDGVTIAATAPDIDGLNDGAMYINSSDNKLYSKTHNDYIVNPSANARGKTRVGGVLNMNRDEYFDFNNNGEIIYGEYDEAAKDLISNAGYSGADEAHDVNGVGDNEPSTFVAKHRPGTKYYTDFFSPANDALFKHAEYESISSIAPARDQYDYLSNADPLNPTSVCKTRADDNHLARLTLTVYLEGWDFSVVDKEISHSFDLGLTFEMSRL